LHEKYSFFHKGYYEKGKECRSARFNPRADTSATHLQGSPVAFCGLSRLQDKGSKTEPAARAQSASASPAAPVPWKYAISDKSSVEPPH